MRALLVVNPAATTTTDRSRDVIARAFASDLDLTVTETSERGHAAQLAESARAEGIELVIAHGGDGTLNEVVNGLLSGFEPDPGGPSLGAQSPQLAVIPGGSTNVFARTLGIPNDPIEATGQALDALRHARSRSIGLGRADGRWFTFCAGLGLDAAVVASVEEARSDGQRSTASLYVRSALREFFAGSDRDSPALTLSRPGAPDETGVHLAIVANTAPWTFLGPVSLNPCPNASFDTGLDLLALRQLNTVSTLRHLRQMIWGGRPPRGRDVIAWHDEAEFTIWANRPTPFQIDGEHLGDRMSVQFASIPHALRVAM